MYFSSKLAISSFLDYKQDTTINCASVVCELKSKHPVRRSSSTRGKSTPTGNFYQINQSLFDDCNSDQFAFALVRNDFTNQVQAENVLLKSGENTIELNAKATRVGLWNFKQV